MKAPASKIELIKNNRTVRIAVAVAVVLLASAIFAIRYRPAFSHANFYAEDGNVFTDNALHKNPIATLLTGFNGYLVSGLYLLVELAVVIYRVFDLPFYQLPVVMAAISCLFLGLTVSLPFLLLRKRLGAVVSLGMVAVGAFVALPLFDYAIIGTIGNLKFVFLYWVFLFAIYRSFHAEDPMRTVLSDLILLGCVLTYAPSIIILPFILWPYVKEFRLTLRKRSFRPILKIQIVSSLILLGIACLYLAVVYLKGIPKIPGYLDTPYQWSSTMKIAYRTTWYAWLFPITSTMRDLLSLVLITAFAFIGLRKKVNRYVITLGLWSIFVATVSFVVNRPGISIYFQKYDLSPDQFFYAQTLVFMFITLWLLRDKINKSRTSRLVFIGAVFIFLWWSAPFSGTYGSTLVNYVGLGTAQQNVKAACKLPGKDITLQEYPLQEWKWNISKDIACAKQ